MTSTVNHILKNARKSELLSEEEERSLFAKYKFGSKEERKIAFERLVQANMRLVVSIAKDYLNAKVPFEDLIQEGNLGLITAIERFDPNMGTKLSTYASYWIRQRIKRYLEKNAQIQTVSSYTLRNATKVKNAYNMLKHNGGEKAIEEEIAKLLNIDKEKARKYLYLKFETVSLQDPVHDTDSLKQEDVISIREEQSIEDVVIQDYYKEVLQQFLQTLKEKDREIFELYYGINGKREHTLEEIGFIHGVSRERIRQIVKKIEKLLKDYIQKAQIL